MTLKAIFLKRIENNIEAQVIKVSRRKHNDKYLINIDSSTRFINCSIENITKGSVLQIHFNGIVALSFPPQIYAEQIQVVS